MRFGVDREAAGGVDDDDVVLPGDGVLDAGAATATGSPWTGCPHPPETASCPATLPRSGAKTGTPARWPTTSSWVTALGRWRSAATSSRGVALVLEPLAELAGQGRLARPWRPASMMTVGGFLANRSVRVSPAEDADELLVDDLDDLLRRVQRLD
jgi:hypothetical protein